MEKASRGSRRNSQEPDSISRNLPGFRDTLLVGLLAGIDKPTQLRQTEALIEECQRIIDQAVMAMESMRGEFDEWVSKAKAALEYRDRLIERIEKEELWRGGDYESADDWMDQHGLSRQRSQQIRDQLRIAKLINELDDLLPAPSDPMARELRKVSSDEAIKKIYSVACHETHGDPPALARVKVLIGAHTAGVDVNNVDAVREYQYRVTSDEIVTKYSQLPVPYRESVKRRLDEIPDGG